jgi:translation initiation factor 1 (eIF-1/SUI1)
MPVVQITVLENKEKSKVIEPNENTEVQPNEGFELTEPKTPEELKKMKEDIAIHTAKAIAALKTKRLALIEGIKKADQDLRDLGAKRAFKARGPRQPKTEAQTPAAAVPKKKGK